MVFKLPKMFTRIKAAVKPVDLKEIKVVAPDEGFVDGGYETDFTYAASEINSPKENLSAAVHDAKYTVKSFASLVWHTVKFVFHVAETAAQFAAKGLTGTYSHPDYVKSAAHDLGNMVKDAGNIVDGVVSTATDITTAAGKMLTAGAIAAAPYVASGAQKFADVVGSGVIAGVNYALNTKVGAEEEDEGVEMGTLVPAIDDAYADLFGGNDDAALFNQEVTLSGRVATVFPTEDEDDM